MTAPLTYQWTGEVMEPLPRFMREANKGFVVGETYRLAEENERSRASHNHFFAAVEESWRNLPEDLAERYPTSEHLRKYALIKSGFADERSIVCASKAEALRIAAFIKPMDDYAIVVASESTVKVFTAKSQSIRAMGEDDFQRSKSAVLDLLASLVGVTTAELTEHAKAAS